MLIFLSGLLIFLGIVGAILPFLPGPPLGLVGLIIYGFASNFSAVNIKTIVVFALLTLASVILDFIAPALGAKGYKASKWGMMGAFIGGVLGVIFTGPAGLIIGPFLGGFVGEFLKASSAERALKTAWGAFVGFLVGTLFRFAVTLAMAGYFIYALVK